MRLSWTSLLRRLAAFLIGLGLSLIAAETAVRLLPGEKPARAQCALFRAALMPVDSMHYHDFEYPVHKGRNVFRIIVVGDSFSEGAYISFEDRYPKKLEYYLNGCGNTKKVVYQVIDMSVGGRSTPREVGVIERHVEELKPDLIILGYCLNDPEDATDGIEYLRKLRKKCYYRRFKDREEPASFLYAHSALVRLVSQRVFNTRVKRGHLRYYHKLYRDSYPGWQKSKMAFHALAELSRTSHIPVRVVIFPLFSYGTGDAYPLLYIHKKIHSVLNKEGVPYIDLYPLFKDMDANCLQYIPDKDPHPSEIAHRIAAEALWRQLMQEGLTPEGKRSYAHMPFPKYPPKW